MTTNTESKPMLHKLGMSEWMIVIQMIVMIGGGGELYQRFVSVEETVKKADGKLTEILVEQARLRSEDDLLKLRLQFLESALTISPKRK